MSSELSMSRLTILGIEVSNNFHEQYSLLHQTLFRRSHAEVHWICLGPGSTFFAKWEKTQSYKLPPNILSRCKTVTGHGIKTLALGIDEAFVFVEENRTVLDLKGHYGELASYLENAVSPPTVCFADSFEIIRNFAY